VYTKRLLRLIVSPMTTSALMYALLGFVGGLVWLALTASTPSFMTAPLDMLALRNETSQPVTVALRASALGSEVSNSLVAPSSGRVSLQEAINSVRRFADAPGLVLEGGARTEGTASGRANLYYLESVSPVCGEDFFKVDARTAEVIEATFRSRMAPADEAVDLTLGDAEVLAIQFAQAHFWEFEQLTLVDRVTRTGESGAVHSFKWSQLAAASGAELPVSVSVAVMSRSGQVSWYLGQRDRLQIDASPAVERERALQTTRAWLQTHDWRWDLDQPASVRLQVLYDDADQQQLVWSVLFRAREEGPRSTFRLLVDAQTGAIIQAAP
jgi:hypothetical protein